jgi:hypothetical protein
MSRRAFLFLAVATVALVGRTALAAATHEGLVVKTDAVASTLTMTDKDGKNEHTHDVPATATITLDGKAAKLSDLQKGHEVTMTADDQKKVTKVEARSKKQE